MSIKVLVKFFTANKTDYYSVEAWDNSAYIEPSFSASMGIKPGNSTLSAGPSVLKLLISHLSHPDHMVKTQAITMLVARQALTQFSCECFKYGKKKAK